MDSNQAKSRTQLKDRLLRLLKAGVMGSMVLASTTMSIANLEASPDKIEARSLDERVAGLKKLSKEQTAADRVPGSDDSSLLAWWWHNWRNYGSWHNWHNW